jgi:serine/alanine racemase
VYLFDVVNRHYIGSNIPLPLFIVAYAYWATIYGTYLHLWFFPSVIFSLTILSYFGPKLGLNKLLGIALVFYLIGMFGDSYFGLVQGFPWIVSFYKTIFFLMNTTRNGLLFALFFVTLGAVMSQREHHLRPLKAGIYTLISLLFLTWEAFSLRFYSQPNDYNIMIGLIPTAYFGFQFFLGLDLKFKWDYKFIRDSSTVIFFSHPLFLILFNIVFPLYFQDYTDFHSVIRFLFVFILSLLFSILVVKMRNHPRLSFLVKYLY